MGARASLWRSARDSRTGFASPRLISTEYPRRGRGVAATHDAEPPATALSEDRRRRPTRVDGDSAARAVSPSAERTRGAPTVAERTRGAPPVAPRREALRRSAVAPRRIARKSQAPLVEKPFSLKAEVKATPRVKLLAGGLVLALAAVAGYAAGSAAAPSAATALAVEDIVHAPSFSSAQTKKAFGVNFGTGLMKTPPTTSAAMDKYAEAAAKYKIPRLKIWQVGAQRDLALDAIKKAYGSDPLQVMVLVPNSDVAACATDPSYAPQLVSDMKNKHFRCADMP